MSLLLDALKKAAEQKAEKSRQEEVPEAGSPDETVITAAAEETELENPDSTLTQAPASSAQMQTGEDETIVFAEEDISDFLGEPELVRRDQTSNEDATDLDQTEYQAHHQPDDATEIDQTEYQTQHELGDEEASADATEIDQTEYQTQHELGDEEASADATEIDQTEYQTQHELGEAERSVDATEVDQTEYQTQHEPDDATEIDQTEYQPHYAADDTESSSDATELQHDALQDDDMSLLLVDHDDTNLTGGTSLTDPQTPQGLAQAIATDDVGVDDLALVDTTQHQVPGEATDTTARTQTSATTGIASSTQVTPHATTRMDSTSTQTYAPDNYDRTLVKLPSDDATKIFAGMKSDSDVVMTPDYAKKVFRSKSSAHRAHAYKVYSGIVIVILLSISMYGALEFQGESDRIDSSLRPLKRDPMPGIIKPEEINQGLALNAEPGANARTIEIIESADTGGETVAVDEVVIADEAMTTDEAPVVQSAAEVDDSAVVADSAAPAQTDSAAPGQTDSAAPTQVEPVATTQVASITPEEITAIESASNASTLEIISSSQVEQKTLWLHEAYNAYKSGDNKLALTRYNQVLEVDPGSRDALLGRAAINVQDNNSTAAIRDYQALLVLNPKDSLATASLIAVANLSPRETESQLKLMIRDEPDSPYLNFALANAYGAQNRWQEAQGYYFRALENNPGDPNYAYNLAVSLEHIAQPLAAVSYYRRALENIGNSLATFNRDIVNQRVELLVKQ